MASEREGPADPATHATSARGGGRRCRKRLTHSLSIRNHRSVHSYLVLLDLLQVEQMQVEQNQNQVDRAKPGRSENVTGLLFFFRPVKTRRTSLNNVTGLLWTQIIEQNQVAGLVLLDLVLQSVVRTSKTRPATWFCAR